VLCFERAEDAQHVWRILGERFKEFGLGVRASGGQSRPPPNALARKIAGVLFAMWRDKTNYSPLKGAV
jgi:hypothetical protein